MPVVNVAMAQILVVPGEREKNLKRVRDAAVIARKKGAQIAVFPECSDLGWACSKAGELAQPIEGETAAFYQAVAKETGLYLAAGLTERDSGRVYNTAVLIDSQGRLIGKHRKINLIKGVESMYTVGDRLCVYDTPYGRLGLNICADNLMPSVSLGESLAQMGARVILSPSAWAVSPERHHKPYGREWYEPYTHLSKNFGVDVVGVSNVGRIQGGEWDQWYCIGNSIAVGDGGERIVTLPYGEEAQAVELFPYEL